VVWVIFVAFLLITPAAVWATWAAKLRAGGTSVPINPKQWPWWPLAAATIAFAVWAAALPESIFTTIPGFRSYMATIALIVLALGLSIAESIRKPTSSGS